MKKIIITDKAPAPIGPYNQAVLAGNTLYVSGQIPLDPISGEMKNADIEMETRQVMKNLEAILKEAGADFSNVVKCSIFVKDLSNFATINKIYGEYFKEVQACRTTVEVKSLPTPISIELEVIATLS